MRKVTLLPAVGDVTVALHVLRSTSQHSIEGPTSLEVATRRLSSANSPTVILGVTEAQSVRIVAPPTTPFCLGPGAQGIIAAAI